MLKGRGDLLVTSELDPSGERMRLIRRQKAVDILLFALQESPMEARRDSASVGGPAGGAGGF